MKNLKSMAVPSGHIAAVVTTNSPAQAAPEAFLAGASFTASRTASPSNTISVPSPSSSPTHSSASSSFSSFSSFTSSPSTATTNPSLSTYIAPPRSSNLPGKPCSANPNPTISNPDAPPTLSGALNQTAGHSGDLPSSDCKASICNQSSEADLNGTTSEIHSTPRDSSAGYLGAEDALARALYLISDLSLVSEDKRPKVQSAQEAVAEAVPLVGALRSEVDELRTQLAAYGKLMAERDLAMERLRADLADLEEARSLYRQQIAELCTTSVVVTTPPTSAELQRMSGDLLQPLSETLLLARGTCPHSLRCMPPQSDHGDLDKGDEGREIAGTGQAVSTRAATGLSLAHRTRSQRSVSPPSAWPSSEQQQRHDQQQQEHQQRHLLPPRHPALGCLPAWGSGPRVPSSSSSSVCGSAVSVREAAARVLPSPGLQVRPPSPTRIDETSVWRFASLKCVTGDANGANGAMAPAAPTVTAPTDTAVTDPAHARGPPCCTAPKVAAPATGSRGSSGTPVSPATFSRNSVKRFGPASNELPFSSPFTPIYQPGSAAAASATLDASSMGLRHTISGWEGYGLSAAAALAAAATGVRKLWPTREWSDNGTPSNSATSTMTATMTRTRLATAVSVGTAGVDAKCGPRTAADKVAMLRARRNSYVWRQRGSRGGVNGGDASGASAVSARGALWESSRLSQAGGSEAMPFVWLNADEVESVPAWEAATAMVL